MKGSISLKELFENKKYRKLSLESLRMILGFKLSFKGYSSLPGEWSNDKAKLLYKKWHSGNNSTPRLTKKQTVAEYLEKHKNISLLESINKCGESHLPRAIAQLEREGFIIMRDWQPLDGRKRGYIRYYLTGKRK